jgi:hypothetical protein
MKIESVSKTITYEFVKEMQGKRRRWACLLLWSGLCGLDVL